MKPRPFLLLVLLGLAGVAHAQEPAPAEPYVFGVVQKLNSAILGQERVVNVWLPDGYNDTTATYPVIYVLDGTANEDFPHIAGLVQFMNMYELLPKSIVVGIANIGSSRRRDFTHPTRNDSDLVWIPTGGGSEPFIEFLATELQPFVVEHYRTNGMRTIIGQSAGGLLATEILFKRPEMFDNYILVSPSLWWDSGSLAETADDWANTNARLPKKVFLAMAPDDAMMQDDMDKVVAAFTAHAKAPFQWKFVPFPEESHMTILHRAAYRAFEWLTTGK